MYFLIELIKRYNVKKRFIDKLEILHLSIIGDPQYYFLFGEILQIVFKTSIIKKKKH